jgi:Amt family ammonium transporter
MGGQAKIQLLGAAAVIAWSAIGSIVILTVIKRLIGLRASGAEVEDGLDLSHHGERAYSP